MPGPGSTDDKGDTACSGDGVGGGGGNSTAHQPSPLLAARPDSIKVGDILPVKNKVHMSYS